MQKEIDKVVLAVQENIEILVKEQSKHGYAFRIDSVISGKSLRFRFPDGYELEI